MSQDKKVTVEMQCAGEEFALRTFEQIGEGEELDYVCECCGHMQQNAAHGAAEMCRNATWHDQVDYERYADVARAGGLVVPDVPPNFVPAAPKG